MTQKKRPIQIDEVGPTGIYPASGPLPPGDAEVIGQGELGHPEKRRDSADQEEDAERKEGESV